MLQISKKFIPRVQNGLLGFRFFGVSAFLFQNVAEEQMRSHDASVGETKPSSFTIKNPKMRKAVLQGYKEFSGPPSLKSRTSRARYTTPIGLDEVFPLAYNILQEHQQKLYSKATDLKQQICSTPQTDLESVKYLKSELSKTLISAEIDNPEVQYNYKIGQIDWEQPVYRHLAKHEWLNYDLLVLMQRLESLSVIPDTEPTLDPKVQVKLQFPGYVNKYVTPGAMLPSVVCSRPPYLEIQEFEEVAQDCLYTVVIVDPDTPDLENDSYTTTLHWAVSNIPLSLSEPVVELEKSDELLTYIPPIPEKNTGNHRYSVWVYRQNEKIDIKSIPNNLVSRENFKIRDFSSQLNLTAVGAHLWRCHFDRSTEKVREKYGLQSGRVFTRTRQ
ncbi:mitochondrial 54S ribosomal protein mL38 [Magnusiomyces paraingens]|uniref:Large ribosomal subunit protein mL38 n=1 Tax=Magnusiomyces paraingens TaxID=2606893 RepID=A0A5E8BB13_9ASCO|nr:uncharacterized protein SAPINGB_P001749 [Saprochaete ingens]VVT48377.1 unnamed protein product [Saprochaete ingens]